MRIILLVTTIVILSSFHCTHEKKETTAPKSFSIDYENNRFSKDGQPYRYISGSIHYFRVPSYYWIDRLTKIKAAGLNAVQFYVAWNVHELTPGNFSFEGDNDLVGFINAAQKVGLDVIVRLGPYTCGEFENGGIPWWLLKIPDIKFRQADYRFLFHMTKWYTKLMPMLVPLLYKNGGPIISFQLENEYGSRPWCDQEYLIFLRDLIRGLVGPDVVLFTVDGAGVSYLKCGVIPDVYPTVDFGTGDQSGVRQAFSAQRAYASKGPLVNTEFYPGWLDVWGYNHSTSGTEEILTTMQYMYEEGASFNFYMFEGGTNFGYMNGESGENIPMTTSYDYDAPLTEAGDPTPKLLAIRAQIEKLTGNKINTTVPAATEKSAYGSVPLAYMGNILTLLNSLSPNSTHIQSKFPLTFEQIDFPYGFVLYETSAPSDCNQCQLNSLGINDQGHVIVEDKLIGKVSIRGRKNLTIPSLSKNAKIRILVENNGRQCSGYNDPKGLNQNVTLNGEILTEWTIYPIEIGNIYYASRKSGFLSNKKLKKPTTENYLPSIYYGKFPAPKVTDTFFNSDGWGKGQFFLNGYNVGRYWPSLGPQVTLYVPKPMVRKLNYVVMFELDSPGNCQNNQIFTCNISFDDKPYLNKTVVGPTVKTGWRYGKMPAKFFDFISNEKSKTSDLLCYDNL